MKPKFPVYIVFVRFDFSEEEWFKGTHHARNGFVYRGTTVTKELRKARTFSTEEEAEEYVEKYWSWRLDDVEDLASEVFIDEVCEDDPQAQQWETWCLEG